MVQARWNDATIADSDATMPKHFRGPHPRNQPPEETLDELYENAPRG